MFFTVSKLVWALFNPGNLLLAGLCFGLVGLLGPWDRPRRAARGLLLFTAGAAALVAVLPLADWLARPLESRFEAPAPLPPRLDGILVLGGGLDPRISAARGKPELNGAGDRLTALVALSRRYPEARLIYAGGSGSLRDQAQREADYAVRFLEAMGLEPGRIEIERDSRNTRENALLSRRLVQPRPGEVWLLVTSAGHMPRAVGVFRELEWPVVPYPVDHRLRGRAVWDFDIDFARDLGDLNRVVREWIGLLVYRLAGWTDALLPGPEES